MTARGWLLGLIQAGVGVGLTAVLLTLAQRPLRRRVPARWFCAVWLLLALRLVLILPLPGLVRLPLPQGLAFLTGPAELAGGETGTVPDTAPLPDTGGAGTAGGWDRPENGAEPLPPDGVSAGTVGAGAAGSGQERSGGQDARERAVNLLFGCWAVGCAGVLAWRLGGHFHFRRRLLRWAEPPEEEARQVLAREMEKLGLRRQVRLVTSGEGPLLLGPLCPVLALPLPAGAGQDEKTGPHAENETDTELGLTLRHELAHLARHDLAFKALLALACALHWANPFVWWMTRRAAAEMEIACDELALRGAGPAERRGYGEAIIAAASRRSGSGPALCTGFWGGKSGLRRRFEALVEGPVTPKRAAAPLFGLFAALLLALGWLTGAVGADGSDAAAPGGPGGTASGPGGAVPEHLDHAQATASGPGDTDAQAEWQQTAVDFARNRNAYAAPVYAEDGETILAMRCEVPAGPESWQREDPVVRMSFALPAGWTVRPAAAGEEVYAAGNGLNAPFNLFDAEGGWAGTMQYGSFTAEQLRDEGGFYGSGVHAAYYWLWGLPGGFGWDEQSCRPAAGDALLDDPTAAGALLCETETAGRAQAGHEGVLAHDGALGRFVVIELRAGALSEAERLRLAESITLLAGDGPADTVPLLPGEPALPEGYAWQEAALGLPGSGLEELVTVQLALPEGCTLQLDTEQETIFGLASAGALILRDGRAVGRLACGGFEPVADWPPENPRQVYAQLMLSNHTGWDFDYQELARNETVSVAVCLVGREASPRGPGDAPPPAGQEPENYRDGWWYRKGVLCCDNTLGVYAAIELEYGEFSDEVCRSIAGSVRLMTG